MIGSRQSPAKLSNFSGFYMPNGKLFVPHRSSGPRTPSLSCAVILAAVDRASFMCYDNEGVAISSASRTKGFMLPDFVPYAYWRALKGEFSIPYLASFAH